MSTKTEDKSPLDGFCSPFAWFRRLTRAHRIVDLFRDAQIDFLQTRNHDQKSALHFWRALHSSQ